MGCQLAKENHRAENAKQTNTKKSANPTMASQSINSVDYKSRLEWKLCTVLLKMQLSKQNGDLDLTELYFMLIAQAKDTPEPEFDLSECNLKDVPSGVFVLCRVLLKERLKLQTNQLQSLNNGGQLSDLAHLKLLDLSFNLFLRLPDNLCIALKNLRVFLPSLFCFWVYTSIEYVCK